MGQIRVGKAQVRPDTPTHVRGVEQGNREGGYDHQVGHYRDGTADARRSTGIGPKRHNAILNIMPNLPPG
jgi:hypothetical protein